MYLITFSVARYSRLGSLIQQECQKPSPDCGRKEELGMEEGNLLPSKQAAD